MNHIYLSIVIPFHNEEESLAVLLPRLLEVLRKTGRTWELILVDDKSTDRSASVVERYKEEEPSSIHLIQLLQRGGQTGCFKAAFEQAKGDYIIRMDADLQDDPRDLPAFLHKFDEGADLVMGLRECRKHKRIYRLASYVYDFLVVLLFNSPLHANSGSFVGFRSKYVKNIPFCNNDHRYIPLIVIRRGAEVIKEVFVRHNARQFGESKYKPMKKLVLGIFEVFRFFLQITRGYYDIPADVGSKSNDK